MSYQAVIRNSSNALVTNKNVGMKISILQSSVNGTVVYSETQTPTTNANGLVSIEIGSGTTTDKFSDIDWTKGTYFLKTETDPTGGTNYSISGTSQLLSVPYALHAKTADRAKGILGNLSINTDINWAALNVGGIGLFLPGFYSWGSQIALNSSSLPGGKYYSLSSVAGDAAEGQGKLVIANNNGAAFTIDSLKNVGIGTLNPLSKLDVAGDINVNNNTVKNLANPVNKNDAATKAYVDSLKRLIQDEILDAGLHGVVKDIDGSIYKTLKIGTQVWMTENLKTTRLNNGMAIPLVEDSLEWGKLATPGYCWYNNNKALFTSTYGALYNWYTVNTGNLCPSGWHISNYNDWLTLVNFLGGINKAGVKLKEVGTTHWIYGNVGATNESGFTALPGGYRNEVAFFDNFYTYAGWWGTNLNETVNIGFWGVNSTQEKVYYYEGAEINKYGLSVRCVRD